MNNCPKCFKKGKLVRIKESSWWKIVDILRYCDDCDIAYEYSIRVNIDEVIL